MTKVIETHVMGSILGGRSRLGESKESNIKMPPCEDNVYGSNNKAARLQLWQ